ncbi:hypothetical protein OEZ86_000199 [Tetradesmus obliquus]|nr:hypothetical protein OEZ86_000199 [Tetradesmus obliquus]
MTVPPTDVDSYGVVKNTAYHEYLYAARVACGASLGFPLEVLLEQYGVMTATISVTTHFKSPLQLGDVFFAETVPVQVKGATVKFKERVVRLSNSGSEQQVVAEGEATCVGLLPGCPPVKPARIPAPFRQALLRCMDAAASAEAVAHN